MRVNLLQKATSTLIITDGSQLEREGVGAIASLRELLLGLLDDLGQLVATLARLYRGRSALLERRDGKEPTGSPSVMAMMSIGLRSAQLLAGARSRGSTTFRRRFLPRGVMPEKSSWLMICEAACSDVTLSSRLSEFM